MWSYTDDENAWLCHIRRPDGKHDPARPSPEPPQSRIRHAEQIQAGITVIDAIAEAYSILPSPQS
jgi:hypothetical protein